MISGNNNIPYSYTDTILSTSPDNISECARLSAVTTVDSADTILEDAVRVTSGPRRRDYDSPTPNHERIARLWNAYIQSRKADAGEPLSTLDVSHMMILLKLARAVYTPTRDSYVDIAGYAQCAAQIAGFDHEAKPEPLSEK